MVAHTPNRDKIVEELRRELVGPSPFGAELDCTQSIIFTTKEESYKPWVQKGSGDEILQRDSPSKRYGIGVLYPLGTPVGDKLDDAGVAATGFTTLEIAP